MSGAGGFAGGIERGGVVSTEMHPVFFANSEGRRDGRPPLRDEIVIHTQYGSHFVTR